MTMFPHRGIVADLCNSLFPMGLRNTETRYFVLCFKNSFNSALRWFGMCIILLRRVLLYSALFYERCNQSESAAVHDLKRKYVVLKLQ